jgi:aquaporin Z
LKTLTEFLGTFFFLLVFALVAVNGAGGAPFAVGGMLMVMVYMGGHVSGAHYNPAVSTAVLLRGKMETKDFGPYLIAQIVAGILAFAAGFWITGSTVGLMPAEGVDVVKALIVEILFTCALALTVLNVATSKDNADKGFYGLAIGFAVIAAAFAGGPISGGAFNPAIGIGATVTSAIWGGGSWANLWIYLVGPLVGGALAAFLFKAHVPAELAD